MDAKIVAVFLVIALLVITPVPMIGSITPDYGLNNGTVEVMIRGEKFDNKATIKLVKPGEADIIGANVKIISKDQISCSFDLRGRSAGKWNVVVANKNEFTKKIKSAILDQGFTIQFPAPTISAISPNHGLRSEVVSTNLTGTGFRPGAKVILNKGSQNMEATDVIVLSTSQITSRFNLEKAGSGTYDLKVVNDDGKTGVLEDGFVVGNPAPEVTAVNPNRGIISEIIVSTIDGYNFRTGAKVFLDNGKQTIEATDLRVISDTQISAVLDLTDSIPGTYDLTVTNDDGKSGSLTGGFKIEYPAPIVIEVEPNQGINTETVTVNLTGTNFRIGAQVELIGEQTIEATDVQVLSDSQISVNFDLTDAIPGTYDLTVTNDDGKSGSLTGGFKIEYPAPTVIEVEPNQGINTETVTVNLTGTNFRIGAQVELIGEQTIEATDVQVLSDSQISVNFDLTDAIPGTYDLTVTNDDGKSGSLTGGFKIEYPAPTVIEVEPNQGINTETVTVNLTGTNFRTGAQVELDGEQTIEATDVRVISDTQITADFDLTDAISGTYDVGVTNDDGKSGSLAGGFRIIVKPTIDSITPDEGFNNGSLLTEISGTNFEPGTLVKLRGAGQVEIPGLNIKIKNSREITCFFDLNQKPIGSYDVVVINPNGQESILANGFTIKEYIPTNREINELLKPVFFDFDKSEVRPDQISTLETNVKILLENPDLYILLGGHADERGTREYNLELTERRAVAVKEFVSAKGVDSSRIFIYAYGKDYPVKKGHDESSWWYNRRVDTLVWEAPPTREQGLIHIVPAGEEN